MTLKENEGIKKQSIKNWSSDDRPREKFLEKGRESLSDAELIAILISSGNHKESAVDLSKRILKDVSGSLVGLSKLSIEDLTRYRGIGEAKAVTIAAALELGRRRRMSEVVEKKSIKTSKDVFEYMQPVLSDKAHEEFWVINVNVANQIIKQHLIGRGGFTQASVDIRQIFKLALENNATSVILCHNHPSGNTLPSESDNDLTKKIASAGQTLNIKVLDHVIIGDEKYYSYADNGCM